MKQIVVFVVLVDVVVVVVVVIVIVLDAFVVKRVFAFATTSMKIQSNLIL